MLGVMLSALWIFIILKRGNISLDSLSLLRLFGFRIAHVPQNLAQHDVSRLTFLELGHQQGFLVFTDRNYVQSTSIGQILLTDTLHHSGKCRSRCQRRAKPRFRQKSPQDVFNIRVYGHHGRRRDFSDEFFNLVSVGRDIADGTIRTRHVLKLLTHRISATPLLTNRLSSRRSRDFSTGNSLDEHPLLNRSIRAGEQHVVDNQERDASIGFVRGSVVVELLPEV